ncbi:MAG: TdeIII family type II restriction endonuclease [Candidatus Bathyarchaeota archaeon]|nr:TdeIII family type II restriction endonuclease [Candidatus Bathyarchaeota archaeon]
MKNQVREELKNILINCIEEKIENYNPESESKPFFEAIFSKKIVNTASLIQSFYTSFGTSIYEQMAVLLAEKNAGYHAERQYVLLGEIDVKTEILINQMHLDILKIGQSGRKESQVTAIKSSILPGKADQDPESIVDVFIKKPTGEEFYFDVTSPKGNIKEFRTLKKKLLRWTALRLSINKQAIVNTGLAIPYNPYHPQPYARWTSTNLYDDGELMVGSDFWNFVAAEPVYEDLLAVFKEVGLMLKPKIDEAVGR